MVFFIALSNAWIAEIISYHSVPWIGEAKHRNHIKIYCAQAMQVNSIFQILQANERSFIHFVVHILDTQIFAERWEVEMVIRTYLCMVGKWKIQQITHFIANWNFMFWHDWKLHKTLIFYIIMEFYRSHRYSDESCFFYIITFGE